MKNNTLRRSLLFFTIFSLIEYLLFHAIYLYSGIDEFALHIIRFSITVFPPLVGVGVIYGGIKTRNNIFDIAYIYIAKLPFFFLYVYVFAHELFRMTTSEIVLYAILFAVILALVYFLLSLLVYFVIRGKMKKSGLGVDTLIPIKATDFKNPITTGLLTLPLIFFIFEFGYEIYNTVVYLISYHQDYRLLEIVYLALQYIFILLKLIVTMLLSKLLLNHVLAKKREGKQE